MRFLALLSPDEIRASRRINLDPPIELAVIGNTVTISQSWHSLSAPAGAAAIRRLSTILGGNEGDLLVLEKSPASPGDPIIDDAVGNLRTAGDFTLNVPFDKIVLIFRSGEWHELARSNN